jgi:hypothetical protein
MSEMASDNGSSGWRALHLVALFAFAVTQPLLELLGRNPTYFVAHGSTGWDIIIFIAVLVIGAPAVLVAILAVATRIGPRVRCGFGFAVPYAKLAEGERHTLRFFAVHRRLATEITPPAGR